MVGQTDIAALGNQRLPESSPNYPNRAPIYHLGHPLNPISGRGVSQSLIWRLYSKSVNHSTPYVELAEILRSLNHLL